MKLYSVPLSPFAARVRLAIYRKGLAIDIVPPESGLKSEAFLALNPMGRIPTLVLDNGEAIPESAAIIEYLEDAFPTPSLRPTDPVLLARARLFLRIPDLYFQNAPRILVGMRNPADRKDEVVKKAMEDLRQGLSYMNHFIEGGPWAVGGAPSIADCAIVPVLNVVSFIGELYGDADLISRYPKLGTFWAAARIEPISARVVGEQDAARPKPAQS